MESPNILHIYQQRLTSPLDIALIESGTGLHCRVFGGPAPPSYRELVRLPSWKLHRPGARRAEAPLPVAACFSPTDRGRSINSRRRKRAEAPVMRAPGTLERLSPQPSFPAAASRIDDADARERARVVSPTATAHSGEAEASADHPYRRQDPTS